MSINAYPYCTHRTTAEAPQLIGIRDNEDTTTSPPPHTAHKRTCHDILDWRPPRLAVMIVLPIAIQCQQPLQEQETKLAMHAHTQWLLQTCARLKNSEMLIRQVSYYGTLQKASRTRE